MQNEINNRKYLPRLPGEFMKIETGKLITIVHFNVKYFDCESTKLTSKLIPAFPVEAPLTKALSVSKHSHFVQDNKIFILTLKTKVCHFHIHCQISTGIW